MKYRLAYIDEEEQSLSNFYSHFIDHFDLIMIEVNRSTTINSILDKCFEEEVDAIITDYNLIEGGDVNFNGNELIDKIKNKHPYYPVIMLTSYEPDAINHMENVHLIYNKDVLNGSNNDDLKTFYSRINNTIKNYYKKIEDTNTRIDKLVDKRKNNQLDLREEEELTKLYMVYDDLNPDGKEIPTNLIQREAITQLNSFVNEAKEILDELKKINSKNK